MKCEVNHTRLSSDEDGDDLAIDAFFHAIMHAEEAANDIPVGSAYAHDKALAWAAIATAWTRLI